MSDNLIRPKSTAGAIAVAGPPHQVIAFQYNPEQITRRIEPQMVGGQGERSYAVRFVGAPKETIEMQLRFDAIDGLAASDPVASQIGISNRLAQLELLAYPDAAEVANRESLLNAGAIEVIAKSAPLTLLILGDNRRMPVKIEQMSIMEQSFDTNLNPIRASVDISFHVLTYSDVLPSNPAYRQFVMYQQSLERFAGAASAPGFGSS